jgi:hypothetical protein
MIRAVQTSPSLATLAVLAVPTVSMAEERPTWSPGNEVTSRVEPEVRADERSATGDGAYGRFDGDIDLGVHGGAQVGSTTGGAAGVTAHYFSMAGAFVRGVDALGAADAKQARLLSFGIDFRPAFVPRWALDAETGRSLLDLTLDSISLELGAYLADPHSGFGDERGFEASLGFGVPLLGTAPGPWLDARGVLRFRDPKGGSEPAVPALLVGLSWHWMVAVR